MLSGKALPWTARSMAKEYKELKLERAVVAQRQGAAYSFYVLTNHDATGEFTARACAWYAEARALIGIVDEDYLYG
jgi:hypothetical protein